MDEFIRNGANQNIDPEYVKMVGGLDKSLFGKIETLSVFIRFTKEELEDLLSKLDQCHSEGYLNYGDPAYDAWCKLIDSNDNIDAKDGEL